MLVLVVMVFVFFAVVVVPFLVIPRFLLQHFSVFGVLALFIRGVFLATGAPRVSSFVVFRHGGEAKKFVCFF
jgi:hypothetical protein